MNMLNSKPLRTLLLAGLAAPLAACVDPGYYQGEGSGYGYGDGGYRSSPVYTPAQPQQHITWVDAEVVSATPVYRDVRVPQSRQECAQAPVDNGANSAVGTILGGVVGGVVGHQIGGGSGNTVATIAGATIGAIAGNSIANQGGYAGGYSQQCRNVDAYSVQQQPDGYDVAYRYNGEVLHTHTNYEPGSTIRVKVAVMPNG